MMAKRQAFCWIAALALLGVTTALAQDYPQQGPPAPSKVEIQLPEFETNVPKSNFPALPPSRGCAKEDLLGMWRLQQMYESPEGSESAAYRLDPIQYYFFAGNDTYGQLNSGRTELGPIQIITRIREHSSGVLQYVIQPAENASIIYFYRDGQAINSQACFIVTTGRDPWVEGQMLLLPPRGTIEGRLVKGYSKLVTPNRNQPPKNRPANKRVYQR